MINKEFVDLLYVASISYSEWTPSFKAGGEFLVFIERAFADVHRAKKQADHKLKQITVPFFCMQDIRVLTPMDYITYFKGPRKDKNFVYQINETIEQLFADWPKLLGEYSATSPESKAWLPTVNQLKDKFCAELVIQPLAELIDSRIDT